jgi:hypothetical protein
MGAEGLEPSAASADSGNSLQQAAFSGAAKSGAVSCGMALQALLAALLDMPIEDRARLAACWSFWTPDLVCVLSTDTQWVMSISSAGWFGRQADGQ